jgi:hypothetical protein
MATGTVIDASEDALNTTPSGANAITAHPLQFQAIHGKPYLIGPVASYLARPASIHFCVKPRARL